jgi:hypothetical protein
VTRGKGDYADGILSHHRDSLALTASSATASRSRCSETDRLPSQALFSSFSAPTFFPSCFPSRSLTAAALL